MPGTGEEDRGAAPLLKNRYQLGRVVGRGGMCIVYQAWDTRQQRFVAIKRLEPPLNEDPRTRARFDREGRALALLDHPNLVALLDRGSSDNDDYLVFEFVDGRSLKELIREGHISIEAFGLLVGQVAEGLASAHAQGIVHRDVKPQNILIDRLGHAKVSDFGIATGPDWTRVTRAGAVIGSARYMSPEQIRSKPVDARSDIYSLGIVMYEMLTGHTPFDGNNMPEIARQHLQADPPPMTDARTRMPAGLEEMIRRCLEKDPDDRFESMEELIGALVAMGLYRLHEDEVQNTASHRWSIKRGNTGEEKQPDISAEYDRPSSTRTSMARPPREQTTSRMAAVDGPAARGQESDPEAERRWARDQARVAAKKRRRAKRRRLLVGAIALVGLLIGIIFAAKSCGADPAPDIVGKTKQEATKLAGDAGLELEITEVPNFATAGTILTQDPMKGIKSLDGTIKVTIARKPISVQIDSMTPYDPPPGDGVENNAQRPNLTDNNLETSWSTEKYKSPTFAGIPGKTGVGLVFSLADGATMVKIDYTITGWKGEVQKITSDGTPLSVATMGNGPIVGTGEQIHWEDPLVSGRLWFTTLGPLPNSAKYGAVINEISFWK
jgi:serine/threonine protein kinase